MVQLTCCKVQDELPTHEQSFLYFEVSRSDHYRGRYIWLKLKGPLKDPLGRKELKQRIDSTICTITLYETTKDIFLLSQANVETRV
jgi:hypothetical protein